MNKNSPAAAIIRPATLSPSEQQDADRRGREALEEREKPPEDLPRRMKMTRAAVKKRVADFRSKYDAMSTRLRNKSVSLALYKPEISTLEERIRRDIIGGLTYTTDQSYDEQVALIIKAPFLTLIPEIKRFDWRTYKIAPKVRHQRGPTCWAVVATQAFESSLIKQRADFAFLDWMDGTSYKTDQVILNVQSTLNRVSPYNTPTRGWYEEAFNFYLETGIPLSEISFNDFEKRDSQLGPEPEKRQANVKAIAWDWVLEKPWRVPREPKEVQDVKKALLTHGPLAVMVDLNDAFTNYGVPVKAEDQTNPSQNALGKNLRIPANTLTFEQDEQTGMLLLYSSGLDVDQYEENGLLVRFPEGTVFGSSPKPIPLRRTTCDDPVNYRAVGQRLAIPAINAVTVEEDAETGSVNLQFPANTDAQFWASERSIIFPPDKTPVFSSDVGETGGHFVLLIGWDDEQSMQGIQPGAWIIQNSFGTEWGYQCYRSPMFDGDGYIDNLKSSDHGYMYIPYGSNGVGRYAAWIEAKLIKRGLTKSIKKAFAESSIL